MARTRGKPIRKQTERFLLRSMRPSDVDDVIVQWFGDPDLMNYTDFPNIRTRAHFLRWMARFDNRKRFLLAILCNQTNALIGFYTLTVSGEGMVGSANVVIGNRDFWGSGAVLETRREILDLFFYGLHVHKVVGSVVSRNFPAIYNYKALGFRCEGVLKEHVKTGKGELCDLCVFGLLRSEWDQIRGDQKR